MSYSSYLSFSQNPVFDFNDFELHFKKYVEMYSPIKAKINCLGDKDVTLLESRLWLKIPESFINARGNVWMLSIGINSYKYSGTYNMDFSNCVNDAKSLSNFAEGQFNLMSQPKDSTYLFYNRLLINETATKESILQEINWVISNSKPNDYFIFNFAGFTKVLSDSNNVTQTYFIPHGLNDINDTSEARKKGIPLSQFKDLFQFIPADNQLFITEAGNTANFSREFTKALIESNPSIASISSRNRIIMIPNSIGRDYFTCSNRKVNSGPINYFITSLQTGKNIFGLFEKLYRIH
jgi:hypothetical protein